MRLTCEWVFGNFGLQIFSSNQFLVCFSLMWIFPHLSFFNFVKFYWLCYYNCPNYSPFATLYPSTPRSLRKPPPLFMSMGCVHGSYPRVISSLATPFLILYFTSPWLFFKYQFVLLNPLTSSPISLYPRHIWQPSKHSPYSWFWLCSCLLSLYFRFNCW